MALRIAEYHDIGTTARGSVAIPLEPAIRSQVLEVSAGSIQSEPLSPQTCIVSLLSDEDCLIAVGDNPDATNSNLKLVANTEKVISVVAGSGMRIAVTAANVDSVAKMDSMGSLEALVKLLASPADAQKQFALMQAQVAKMNAAAKDLRKSSEDNKTVRDQLAQATSESLAAKSAADKANGDVAQREAGLSLSKREHEQKLAADLAALADRATKLAAGEADLNARQLVANKQAAALTNRSGVLDTRERSLEVREATAAASQADYDARIAKLKALTS